MALPKIIQDFLAHIGATREVHGSSATGEADALVQGNASGKIDDSWLPTPVDISHLTPMERRINTTAPLKGGGTLNEDLTLTLDTSGFAPVARTVTAVAPITGGGSLANNISIGINRTGFFNAMSMLPTLYAGNTVAVHSNTENPRPYGAKVCTLRFTFAQSGTISFYAEYRGGGQGGAANGTFQVLINGAPQYSAAVQRIPNPTPLTVCSFNIGITSGDCLEVWCNGVYVDGNNQTDVYSRNVQIRTANQGVLSFGPSNIYQAWVLR